MLRRVALVTTDVSEVFSASFIGVTRIGELETKLATDARSEEILSIGITIFLVLVIIGLSISSQRSSADSYN
jgi:hypothetical protein